MDKECVYSPQLSNKSAGYSADTTSFLYKEAGGKCLISTRVSYHKFHTHLVSVSTNKATSNA